MDYRRLYNRIIENRKASPAAGYTERHHIIPRSLGGTDDKNNLVDLTAREHFLCHYLLTKMYQQGSDEWHKMNHAFVPMKAESSKHVRYYNSRLYEAARKNFSEVMSKAQSGKRNSQHGTRWIHNQVTQKNKKIPKHEALPTGWTEGRRINWSRRESACAYCAKLYTPRTKELYCSTECQKQARKKRTKLYGREEEFLELYKEHNSMNTALKEMGFDNRGARYYWAKAVLDSQQEDL